MTTVLDKPADYAGEYEVRIGGLMRCCLQSLHLAASEMDEAPPIGTTISCIHEEDPDNQNMILADDGVWEWNKTKEE